MAESIFRKMEEFFHQCSRDESATTNSLKLTPSEFNTFKFIFYATMAEQYFEGKDYSGIEWPPIDIQKAGNDLVIDVPSLGLVAHLQYAPENQALTITGTPLPWKSMLLKLTAVNRDLFDRTMPVSATPDIAIMLKRPSRTEMYGNIYRSLAKLVGMDASCIVTNVEGTPEISMPHVRVPKNIYDKIRAAELSQGVDSGKWA